MNRAASALRDYAAAVVELATSGTTTEATFYPALQSLLTALLRDRGLPFLVRTNTAERRAGGGADLPDLALYEGNGDYAVLLGEVKTPRDEIDELARSVERGDQVGRYLAQTGVVLLSNVRSFALLIRDPAFQGTGPVPPAARRLLEVVELWPSRAALVADKPIAADAVEKLGELLEIAVTEFAAIAEPESLARILARLARRAKAGLPAKFSQAVQPLLDDFARHHPPSRRPARAAAAAGRRVRDRPARSLRARSAGRERAGTIEREQAEAEAVLGSVSDEALAQALAKLETAVTRIQVASRAR